MKNTRDFMSGFRPPKFDDACTRCGAPISRPRALPGVRRRPARPARRAARDASVDAGPTGLGLGPERP
jgi:hypothetical protein